MHGLNTKYRIGSRRSFLLIVKDEVNSMIVNEHRIAGSFSRTENCLQAKPLSSA